jgi:GNAT superfamily N-acetyltransferase
LEQELQAVSKLACEVFCESIRPPYSPEGTQEFLRYAAPEAWRERQQSGHLTWVAEIEGQLVGTIHLRNGNHVAMLFVRAQHQRSGVGRSLVQVATAQARTLQPPPKFMTVNSSPNAVPAYERMGFLPVGPEQTINGIRFVPMTLAL